MKTLLRILFLLILAVLVGGGIWLAATDPPSPAQDMETVISNDRFAR
ncbi:MAG: hypothetical protein O7C63_02130 [Alphaproteobacteria bacterium]|nr:hypothetical protein [Alphaproteobacteria bacterium]MCZ6763713.1 hypothetical protein [Alphaproteobacteria bacterium]